MGYEIGEMHRKAARLLGSLQVRLAVYDIGAFNHVHSTNFRHLLPKLQKLAQCANRRSLNPLALRAAADSLSIPNMSSHTHKKLPNPSLRAIVWC